MSDEPFRVTLAKVSRISLEELTDTTGIAPGDWDSLDMLDLIAAIDEVFDTTVPVKMINRCRTVGELRTLIDSCRSR